jgi:hypothetical protein
VKPARVQRRTWSTARRLPPKVFVGKDLDDAVKVHHEDPLGCLF